MSKLHVETDRRKRYRNKHAKEYKAWRDAKKTCTHCGGKYTNTNRTRHRKTKKCKASRK